MTSGWDKCPVSHRGQDPAFRAGRQIRGSLLCLQVDIPSLREALSPGGPSIVVANPLPVGNSPAEVHHFPHFSAP